MRWEFCRCYCSLSTTCVGQDALQDGWKCHKAHEDAERAAKGAEREEAPAEIEQEEISRIKLMRRNMHLRAINAELLDFTKTQFDNTQCICNFKAAGYTEMPCIKCAAAALIAKAEQGAPE